MARRLGKKRLAQRWLDEDFVRDKRDILQQIFVSHEFHGDADVRSVTVGVDGPLELAASSDLYGAHLSRLDFSNAVFSCSFCRAVCRSVSFVSSVFDHCIFADGVFRDCPFDKARFSCPWLDAARFENCSFRDARLRGGGGCLAFDCGQRAVFENCDFSGALIAGLKFPAFEFRNCVFDDAKFERCFVFNVKFIGNVPSMNQFDRCEYRGRNVGIEVPDSDCTERQTK